MTSSTSTTATGIGADRYDVANLFAYVGGTGGGGTAAVRYGSGATAVIDPAAEGTYTVTFIRSVANCVVQATLGTGDPVTVRDTVTLGLIPNIVMTAGGSNEVQVDWRLSTWTVTDTSFMITAFC